MSKLRQMNLFGSHKTAQIQVSDNHELVRLTELIDWDELIETTMGIREGKIKKATGPEPHYRELLGAVVLMAVKSVQYREAEDLIAHYVPARYLCDLMDSTWCPDHITIFEFTQMLGEDGMKDLNIRILEFAQKAGLIDGKILMSDTTAQEAKIPYPNEVSLMAKFIKTVDRCLKKAG